MYSSQLRDTKHHLQPATQAITVKWRHVAVNGRNMMYVAINEQCEAHSVQLVPRHSVTQSMYSSQLRDTQQAHLL